MCGKVYDCNVHTRYMMGGFGVMVLHQLPFLWYQDWSRMFDMCWGYPVECRSAVSYLYRCNRFFRVGIAPFWRRTLWISPQYTPIHGASSQGGLELRPSFWRSMSSADRSPVTRGRCALGEEAAQLSSWWWRHRVNFSKPFVGSWLLKVTNSSQHLLVMCK